jgi:carboxyl-terminal processing protease
MRLPRPGRPAIVAVAAVTGLVGVAAAFAGGVLVGRGHRPAPSVVDQAIAAVRAHGDDAPDTAQLEDEAVRAIVGGLDDRWAAYYGVGDGLQSTDQLRALLAGRYSGLGLWLRQSDGESGIAVASVVSGTPAAAGGLVAGDQLVDVAGAPVAQQSVEAVTAALRGPTGSVVRLTVRTASGASRSVALTRRDVVAQDVTTTRLAPGIVSIRVGTFAAGTGAQVQQAVRTAEAAHVKGIVLDLRGDPGGLLDEAVAAASAFLDGGPVVHLAGRTVPATTLDAATGVADVDTPLAVLVDGGTASAAEILAGALHDRHRAVVVGSRTFGKGSVQRIVPLSDGSSFELTVATYTTADGHPVDGVGIAPDITVPAAAPPAVGTARAVALLQALASDAGT